MEFPRKEYKKEEVKIITGENKKMKGKKKRICINNKWMNDKYKE